MLGRASMVSLWALALALIASVLPHLALGQTTEGTSLYGTMFTSLTSNGYVYNDGGVTSDAHGNIYGGNYFQGTGNVTNGDWTVAVPAGGKGAFIYKLNTTLGVTWLRAPGGTATFIDVNSVALDPSDTTLFVVGAFVGGTLTYDNVTLTAPVGTSNTHAFLLALDTVTGDPRWGQSWTGTGNNGPYGVGVDSAGNIIMNGRTHNGNFVVNGVTYNAGAFQSESWSMKLSSTGAFQWFNWFSGTANPDTWDIAVHPSGYSIGTFTAQGGSITVGSFTVSHASPFFVVYKQSASGTVQWVKSWTGTESVVGYGLALDSAGQIQVGGYFYGSCTIGSKTFTSRGSSDVLIIKLDTSGTPVWATDFGGEKMDMVNIHSIAVDNLNSVYATGYFTDSMVVNGTTYYSSPANNANAFIVKYSSSGSMQWISFLGGSYVEGGGMTVDRSTGNPVAVGYACPTITLGSTTLSTGTGKCAIYIAELQGTPPPTTSPTQAPTGKPTQQPTQSPTTSPTKAPTGKPTTSPTQQPTGKPTQAPTPAPTVEAAPSGLVQVPGTRNLAWSSLAGDYPNVDIVATVDGGPLYRSIDSGLSWTPVSGTGNYPWHTSAASSDGGIMWAGTEGSGGDRSGLWVSTDGGPSWREVSATSSGLPSNAVWTSVTASADAQKVVATAAGGRVWTSVDSGATFTTTTAPPGNRAWVGISSSGSGGFLLAAERGGSCWISLNGGATWLEQNLAGDPPSPADWAATTMAADGSVGWAADAGGFLWTYEVGPDTWSRVYDAGRQDWTALAVSADGRVVFSGTQAGGLYYSLDGGVTWQVDRSAGPQHWVGITLEADGESAVAATVGGGIYTWVEANGGGKTYSPTTAPTMFPTFAPPPPEVLVYPLQQGVVCGPEVSIVRRQLATAAGQEDGEAAVRADDRALLQGYTPETCYEACLGALGPSPSGFVLNLFYEATGDQVCTCCRECESVRFVSSAQLYAACSAATSGGLILATFTRPRWTVRPGRALQFKVSVRPADKTKKAAIKKPKLPSSISGRGNGTTLNLRVTLPPGVRYIKSSASPPLLMIGTKGHRVKRPPVLDNSGLLLMWEDIGSTPAPKGRNFRVTVRVDSYLAPGTELSFAAQLFESVPVGGSGVLACPLPAPNATVTVV